MRQNLVSFIVGFIFAIGLGISGMTQPQKVVGFLDLFGNWDPSLVFVMIGAILIHLVVYKLFSKRPSPLLSEKWHLPTKKEVTPSLVVGSALFGIGWALAGYCPGPALVSLSSGSIDVAVFVVSMLLGMIIFKITDKKIGFNR